MADAWDIEAEDDWEVHGAGYLVLGDPVGSSSLYSWRQFSSEGYPYLYNNGGNLEARGTCGILCNGGDLPIDGDMKVKGTVTALGAKTALQFQTSFSAVSWVQFSVDPSTMSISHHPSGGSTTILVSDTNTAGVGDTIAFEVEDQGSGTWKLTAYVNDVQVLTTTTTSVTGPWLPGFWEQVTSNRLDDFEWYLEAEGITGEAEDDVEFTDEAFTPFYDVEVTEGISFGEKVLSSSHQTDNVTFADVAGLVFEQSLVDQVNFSDEVRRVIIVAAEDDVEFADTIAYVVAKFVYGVDGITFSDASSEVVEIVKSLSDDVTFSEVPDYFPIEGCETDFVPSPTIPDDPDSILYIYMWGPWATLAYKIRLRRPDFGDVRRGKQRVIVHRTRGGSRRVFKRTPTYRAFLMRFSGMSRKKVLELENFLDNTAGEDIRLVDANGHTWKGNVLTDPTDIATQGYDQGELSLEFEGDLVT